MDGPIDACWRDTVPSSVSRRLAPVRAAGAGARRARRGARAGSRATWRCEALVRRRGAPVGWVRLPVDERRRARGRDGRARPSTGLTAATEDARRAGAAGLAVGDGGGLHPGPHRGPGPLPRLARAWLDHAGPRAAGGGQRPDRATRPGSLVERRGGRGALRPRAEARDSTGPATARSPRPRATSWRSPTTTCSVDPGWVRALAAAFGARPEAVAAVTGLVLPAELETEAQVLFERYRSFARGFAPGGSPRGRHRAAGWPLRAAGRLRHRRQHGVPARRVRPDRPVRSGARRRHAGPGLAVTWRCSSGC